MLSKKEVIHWLREEDTAGLDKLWKEANEIRQKNVGDEVHLRGLIEISNHCSRICGYCGINATNTSLKRYRMSKEEIVSCAESAHSFGYGTVVLQAGEDMGLGADFVADVIGTIKSSHSLAVTLSLGERTDKEIKDWKAAGADRYLIRFETSAPELFKQIHPHAANGRNRIEMLKRLRQFGYEIGSGVMIGIPGQSFETLADDIVLFKELDLDMIGVGPYIPHPNTSLADNAHKMNLPPGRQVPATELMCYKVIALARIVCPQANIPSTTALATLNLANGREKGLTRGANILMPNLTPLEYRALYEIYPSKACIFETAQQCLSCMTGRIISIGRVPGKGYGSRRR